MDATAIANDINQVIIAVTQNVHDLQIHVACVNPEVVHRVHIQRDMRLFMHVAPRLFLSLRFCIDQRNRSGMKDLLVWIL